MLPVVAGADATRLQILLYTVLLVAVAAAPWPLGYFDAAYGVISLALGGGMLWLAIRSIAIAPAPRRCAGRAGCSAFPSSICLRCS